MDRKITYILERRFNTLIKEMNQAYLAFQQGNKEGLDHIEKHLFDLIQKANQFSVDVYHAIVNNANDNDKRTKAIASCTERQQVNLEILAQAVGFEHNQQLQKNENLNIWRTEKNKQVKQLQDQLDNLTKRTEADLWKAKE